MTEADRRPIVIDGDTPAYCHGFVSIDQEKLKINVLCRPTEIAEFEKLFFERHICPAQCEVVKISRLYALAELGDGTLKLITPIERVKFVFA